MYTKRWIVSLPTLLLAIGLIACSRARSDAEITTDVQTKIQADAALAADPINIQCNSGVVVLSGSVKTDTALSTAEDIAKQVEGVKGVVNNLQVVSAAISPPVGQRTMKKTAKPAQAAAPVARVASSASPQTQAAPQPALPVPEPVRVTIPQGTGMTVRLIDPVDSEKNKEGDTFRASLDSPIVIEDKTVIPKNADVETRLVSSKSAGHFTGSSAVVLVMSKITFGGKTYDVQSGEFSKQGASRGKRSAAVIGGRLRTPTG